MPDEKNSHFCWVSFKQKKCWFCTVNKTNLSKRTRTALKVYFIHTEWNAYVGKISHSLHNCLKHCTGTSQTAGMLALWKMYHASSVICSLRQKKILPRLLRAMQITICIYWNRVDGEFMIAIQSKMESVSANMHVCVSLLCYSICRCPCVEMWLNSPESSFKGAIVKEREGESVWVSEKKLDKRKLGNTGAGFFMSRGALPEKSRRFPVKQMAHK